MDHGTDKLQETPLSGRPGFSEDIHHRLLETGAAAIEQQKWKPQGSLLQQQPFFLLPSSLHALH